MWTLGHYPRLYRTVSSAPTVSSSIIYFRDYSSWILSSSSSRTLAIIDEERECVIKLLHSTTQFLQLSVSFEDRSDENGSAEPQRAVPIDPQTNALAIAITYSDHYPAGGPPDRLDYPPLNELLKQRHPCDSSDSPFPDALPPRRIYKSISRLSNSMRPLDKRGRS